MSRSFKLLLAIVVISTAFILFPKPSAAVNFTGSTGSSPTKYRALCPGGTPVDFAAYPSDIVLNPSTGVVTYKINIRWQRCTSGEVTRAYAVYSNREVCPFVGTYGQGGEAYDCIKYIGDPAYNEPGSGLSCPGGKTNGQCITSTFNQTRRVANQPAFSFSGGESISITKSYVIPGWNTLRNSSGNRTIANSRMCQYYKTGSQFQTINDEKRCFNFTIKVSWSVPPPPLTYDARCEVKNIRTSTRTTITSTGGNPTGNIAYLAPKQEFTATFAVRNAGTEAWKLVRSNPDVAENLYRLGPVPDDNTWGQRRLTILGPSNEFGGAALSGGSLSRDFTATFKVPDNLAAGSSRVFTWQVIHDGAGKPNQGWFGSICNATISIRDNRPYLRVSGSDMKAGATFNGKGFEGDDTYKNAPIDTNGRGDGAGSSSGQYAVFASGLINKEASSANNIFGNNLRTLPGNIKDLLFANTGNEGNYGTFYGEGGPPDITISELVNEAGKTPLNNGFGTRVASEGSAHFDGDQELGITSVRGSKVIVVDGDLTINGDVTYNGVGPNLIFVVRGNIFVKADVTKLDGTYIAFPTNKDDGIFDTCSNVAGVAAGVWPDSNQALSVNTCNKQLTITGRLIAKKVLWKRTWGTIGASGAVISGQCAAGDANNSNRISELERCAAEFINFSPEAYFNSPLDSTPTGSVGNVPISTIELPPIY